MFCVRVVLSAVTAGVWTTSESCNNLPQGHWNYRMVCVGQKVLVPAVYGDTVVVMSVEREMIAVGGVMYIA